MRLLATVTVSMVRWQTQSQPLASVPSKNHISTVANASLVQHRTTSTQLVANVRSALKVPPSTLPLNSVKSFNVPMARNLTARRTPVFVQRKNSSNMVVAATNVRKDTLIVRRIRVVLFAALAESSMLLPKFVTVFRIRLSSGIIRPAFSALILNSLISRIALALCVPIIRHITSIPGFVSLVRLSFLSSMENIAILVRATNFGTRAHSNVKIVSLVQPLISKVTNANARHKVLTKFHPFVASPVRLPNTSISKLRNVSTVKKERSLILQANDAFVLPVSLSREIIHVSNAICPNTLITRTRHASLARKISYITPHFKPVSVVPLINQFSLTIDVKPVPKNFTSTCQLRAVSRALVAETT